MDKGLVTWRRAWFLVVTTAVLAAVAAAIATVAAMAASDQFGDVAPGHPHEDGIGFAVDSGVTVGCGDGSDYCPGDPVTRAQMATFLHRLSGHADADPSVDAATVEGLGPDELSGVSDVEIVRDSSEGSFSSGVSRAHCPGDKQALGGGGTVDPAFDGDWQLMASVPMEDGDGWEITYDNDGTEREFIAYAICADVN